MTRIEWNKDDYTKTVNNDQFKIDLWKPEGSVVGDEIIYRFHCVVIACELDAFKNYNEESLCRLPEKCENRYNNLFTTRSRSVLNNEQIERTKVFEKAGDLKLKVIEGEHILSGSPRTIVNVLFFVATFLILM